jgi:hypothetical protein
MVDKIGRRSRAGFFYSSITPFDVPACARRGEKKFALKIDIYQRICGEQD